MPWSWIAMASSADSSARRPSATCRAREGAEGDTSSARPINSSVVSPIAEITTTTS